MSKSTKRLMQDYEELYGDIPSDAHDQLVYLCEKYNIDHTKYKDKIAALTEKVVHNWREAYFDLPLVPIPAKRPRSSSDGHFYVEGAAQHRKLVQKLIDYNGIVYTECKVDIGIYVPMPVSSMTKEEILEAQLGLIRPINKDWDNFAKTYCDSIQDLLITNDNIIIKGSCEKWYSIKPHATIDIKYQTFFDSKFNERKILQSKSYERNYERVKMDEYTNSGLPSK